MIDEQLTKIEYASSRSLRIGVVDDNRDATTSLAMLLRIAGNEDRIAHDGREAVTLAESFRPDILLLDLGLPVMDGYEAAEAIRAQPWGRDMKILATTGWDTEAERAHTKSTGFDGHLVKPLDLRLLGQLLAALSTASS